jgi:hypothetical protein
VSFRMKNRFTVSRTSKSPFKKLFRPRRRSSGAAAAGPPSPDFEKGGQFGRSTFVLSETHTFVATRNRGFRLLVFSSLRGGWRQPFVAGRSFTPLERSPVAWNPVQRGRLSARIRKAASRTE